MDINLELPGWLRDQLKLPPVDSTVEGYKSDWGNWVVLWNSFEGFFSTPAPGTIVFSLDDPNLFRLVNGYLAAVGQATNTALTPIAREHPLYPFFAQVVASETSAGQFLAVLRSQQRGFDLKYSIAGWQQAGLPGAAWEQADDSFLKAAEVLTQEPDYYSLEYFLRAIRWESGKVIHDQRQYLLFGQNAERITPSEWIQAAWPFIQRFRVNFGMFVTQAMIYDRVTIVGTREIDVPVTGEDEAFLRTSAEADRSGVPEVERLEVSTPDELAQALEQRIASGRPFGGERQAAE